MKEEILNAWGDLETGSLIDLKSCGGYRYAEDSSTFVQLFSYALGDESVKLWDPYSGEKMPDDLHEYLHNPKYIWTFHNAQFDRLILRHCLKLDIPIRRFRCSMAQALSHALPGSLEKCGEVLNIREDARKIKDGKRLMMMFCKPQKKRDGTLEWRTPETHPEEWARYREYAINDTAAMREITKKLPKWNYPRQDELELWFLDQETNDAGINIDVDMVRSALTTISDEQKKLSAKTCEMTDGEVQAASQRDAMIRYVASQYGIELSDLRKATVEKLIEDTETPPDLAELLRVRLSTCTTSTAKYKRLNNCTSLDGRMRGIIQYFGASRTGRDASKMAQFQNLPRPTVRHEEIMSGIDAVKNGTTDLLGYDVMPLLSSALRYVIHAPKGKKLAVADLAGIENRVLAYLAGEHWKLKAFRDFDNGIGDDMYKSAYAKAFRINISEVTKDQRAIGKVLELSCGYSGSAGAIVAFATAYGVDLNELTERVTPTIPEAILAESESFYDWLVKQDEKANKELAESDEEVKEARSSTYNLDRKVFVALDSLKRLWRNGHPATVKFWKDTEEAAKNAVEVANTKFTFGNGCYAIRKGKWVLLVLPSKHVLCYPAMELDEKGKLRYRGVHQFTKKWTWIYTFSGKLVENLVQSFSRDIFKYGQLNAVKQGYKVVLPVHDELVTEVPDTPEYSVQELEKIMSTNPPWALDIPLAAEGFEDYRYHK